MIAIPGIDGHAYGSWKSKGGSNQVWLRHYLEEEMPSLRVMIYGYHAKLGELAGGGLDYYTKEFLQELRTIRASEEVNLACVLAQTQLADHGRCSRFNAGHCSSSRTVSAAYSPCA